MTLTLKQEQRERVAEIVKADLDQRFAGEFEFKYIVQDPVTSVYGDDYLPIIVLVVNGNGESLDPSWRMGTIRRVRPKLHELGITAFPNIRYVDESEWLDEDYYADSDTGV